jgi:hypothetical protein
MAILMQKLKWENNDQEMAMKSKKIVHKIQEKLKKRVTKYDNLVNKHVMLKKELVLKGL